MKKSLVLLMSLLLIFALAMVGCSNSNAPAPGPAETTGMETTGMETSGDASWDNIKAKGYMTVGLDDSFPPMGYRDEASEIVGFDIDLAKATAEKMGIEVRFQSVDWSAVFLELNNGTIDLIWNGMTINEERLAASLITRPYLTNSVIIMTRGDSDIATKADLAGKKVGIQAGSTSNDKLKADPIFESIGENNLIAFPNNMNALLDLKNGQVDAVVLDEIVGRYYTTTDNAGYKILDDNFGSEDFGVAVRKTDVAFFNELQKGLDAAIADGTAAQISEKWFNENVVLSEK